MTQTELSSFATAIRSAREARGWTREQLAAQLLLSDVQVAGLEQDERSAFYSSAYANRAAVACAALLNVDATLSGGPFVEATIEADSEVEPVPQRVRRAQRIRSSVPRSLWVGLGLVLVVAGGVGIRQALQPLHQAVPVARDIPSASPTLTAPVNGAFPQSAPGAPATSSAPTASAVSQTSRPAVVNGKPDQTVDSTDKRRRFYLVINEAVVVNAVDQEGRSLLSGPQSPQPGTSYYGTPPFSLRTDKADAIELYHMGQRVRPMPDADGGFSAQFGMAPEPL